MSWGLPISTRILTVVMHCMDLGLVPKLLAKCQAQHITPGQGPVLIDFPPSSAPFLLCSLLKNDTNQC